MSARRSRPRGAVLALVLSLGACRPSPAGPAETAVVPVELTLRTSTGAELEFSQLRGRVVLVALLGTYDAMSQASLESLGRLHRHRTDVTVIAVLAQQGARALLDAFAAAADAPYPVGVDPTERLIAGSTGLGRVEAVPTFLALTTDGRAVARHVGYPTEAQLVALCDRALAASPPADTSMPPLLGRPAPRAP